MYNINWVYILQMVSYHPYNHSAVVRICKSKFKLSLVKSKNKIKIKVLKNGFN